MKLVVLLGNENDITMALKPAAVLRADVAFEYLQDEPDSVVITTGTFGDGFNESDVPHGELLAQYLIKKGVHPDRILPFTRSANTLEDAYGVLRYIQPNVDPINDKINEIVIVTSSFHMPRVKYIFGRVILGIQLSFREAGDPPDFDKIIVNAKEAKKLADLKKNWVNIEGFDLKRFPTDSYNNIASELRHYDNLSQVVLTGAAVLFGLVMSGDFTKLSNVMIEAFTPLFAGFALTILFYLYHKFADTAASSRRLMYAIEKLYQVPGLSSTKTKTQFLGLELPAQKAVDRLYYIMIIIMVVVFIGNVVTIYPRGLNKLETIATNSLVGTKAANVQEKHDLNKQPSK